VTSPTQILRSASVSIKRYFLDNRGATAIEYGIIALLVSVAIIASVTQVGSRVTGLFNKVATAIPN
jgi:pilus assembly protein Flp/PilA